MSYDKVYDSLINTTIQVIFHDNTYFDMCTLRRARTEYLMMRIEETQATITNACQLGNLYTSVKYKTLLECGEFDY